MAPRARRTARRRRVRVAARDLARASAVLNVRPALVRAQKKKKKKKDKEQNEADES